MGCPGDYGARRHPLFVEDTRKKPLAEGEDFLSRA